MLFVGSDCEWVSCTVDSMIEDCETELRELAVYCCGDCCIGSSANELPDIELRGLAASGCCVWTMVPGIEGWEMEVRGLICESCLCGTGVYFSSQEVPA